MAARISLTVATEGGDSIAVLFRPAVAGAPASATAGKRRAVIMFPDAFGLREAMEQMASRLADQGGYAVLVPDILHRAGKIAPFDPKTVWGDEKERARLGAAMATITPELAMKDVGLYLDALGKQSDIDAARIGTCGYCLGGALAFRAACTYPDRVAAVAAFHAGNLVNDKPDSPHKGIEKLQARIYLGCADNDRSCTPEVRAQLAAEMAKAGVDVRVELYADKLHGFAVNDAAVFDADAAERHWQRMFSVFSEAFPR